MSAAQLITQLRSRGFTVAASGGRLRVVAERGELTEPLRQAIMQQKSELLALLANEEGDGAPDLVRISRDGVLPLSSFQERLWILHRLEPENTSYNMVTAWQHAHRTDLTGIQTLIHSVLHENDILRAVFRDDGSQGTMHLLPVSAVGVVIRDLRGQSEQDQEATIRSDIASETRTLFDLTRDAPTRWRLYQIADGRFAVLVAAHHIVMDEWSLTILRQRIEQRSSADDRASPTLQYADYAAWQKCARSPATIEREVCWWEKQLAGIPPLCSFPSDRTGVRAGTATGDTRPFRLDSETVGGLRRLVRAKSATLYMALLAILASVLRSHTGLTDIVIGTWTGMRERPEFESTIGPFVNLLVLRLDFADDPSFAELLARARDVVLQAHEYREVPFETLVDRLRPPRSFDRSPLFQVAMVLHNASDETAPQIFGGGAGLDLTWFAKEIDGRVEGALEYRTDLYSPATIDRIAGHLEIIARAVVRDPTRKISQISLLTDAERDRMLVQFNATSQSVDRASAVAQFARQAAAQPDRPAVVYGHEQLSYAELNRRSNQLARLLQQRGVGCGTLVGVCLERSLNMLVALLGVQKSGASYVPIDPQLPAERLRFMFVDSGATTLVTSSDIGAGLDLPDSISAVQLDLESDGLDALDGTDLVTQPGPDDLAYVIYTSGSTGCPNGVAVPHGALSNFLAAMRHEPGLTSDDVMAAVTTISFDIAALELYLPLTVGARIELVPHEIATDGMALAQVLAKCGATTMQATPATWRMLMEVDWFAAEGFRALCGGEALSRDLGDSLFERVSELWNLYGPTETTVWSTVERVERGVDPISIGRPIVNTSVYVLDPAREPTAIGVPGEIWIGGDGVAAGYHRRPDLTGARFVADPFAARPGARMYRTGDLGRWGNDGRLYHLGRLDRQVKLRGFRIELGEIEAALLTHPAVARAAVIAQNLNAEQSRLIAYVVYRPGKELTASEARRHLRLTLPDYMLPVVFVALDALPLTPNGKLDARALPDPFRNTAVIGDSFEPPAPGLEQLIADIWCELLRVDRVGAGDNFFDLGGNSLLALRVVTGLETRAGCRVPPRLLFFHTLRQVAAAAHQARTAGQIR